MTSLPKLKASLILDLPAISQEFAASILADIIALESQDFKSFISAFDDFTEEDLETFKSNIREITSRLSIYRRILSGAKGEYDAKRYKCNRGECDD